MEIKKQHNSMYPDVSLISDLTDVSDMSIHLADQSILPSYLKKSIYNSDNYGLDLDFSSITGLPQKQVRFNPAVAVAALRISDSSIISESKPSQQVPPSSTQSKYSIFTTNSMSYIDALPQYMPSTLTVSSTTLPGFQSMAKEDKDTANKCESLKLQLDDVIERDDDFDISAVEGTDITSLSRIPVSAGCRQVVVRTSPTAEVEDITVSSSASSSQPTLTQQHYRQSPVEFSGDDLALSEEDCAATLSSDSEEPTVSWTYSDVTPRAPAIQVFPQQMKHDRDSSKNQVIASLPEDAQGHQVRDRSVVVKHGPPLAVTKAATTEEAFAFDNLLPQPTCEANLLGEEHGLSQPRIHSTRRLLNRMDQIATRRSTKPLDGTASQSSRREVVEQMSRDPAVTQRVADYSGEGVNVPTSQATYLNAVNMVSLDISGGEIVRAQQRKVRAVQRKAIQVASQAKPKVVFPEPDPLEFFDNEVHVHDTADFVLQGLPSTLPELCLPPPEIDHQLYGQFRDRINIWW